MSRSSFARHRHLILAVVTALLLGLLASMAYAATTHRSHRSGGGYGYGGYGYGGYGYGGYGYGGYGYGGYGYGGYGYGYGCGPRPDCPWGNYVEDGQVYDAAKYADALGHGAPVYEAYREAEVAGASVTLQRSTRGGPWITLPAASVGGYSPFVTGADGFFLFTTRGIGRVRAAATKPGYEPGYSVPKIATDFRNGLSVWLTPVAQPGGGGTTTTPGGGTTTTTTTDTTNNGAGGTVTVPAVPTTPVTPGRPGPVRATGCAARKGPAKAACERAARLATALKACTKTYKKSSRRTLCERRARALSVCDARTGRKRTACRAKALEIGRKSTKKSTKKRAASKHAAHH